MNKRTLAIILLFSLLCMGMGQMDESLAVKDIPEPDREFKVELIDASDTSFEVEHFSVEGLTFIPAEMGRADVALDFAEIKAATFRLQGDMVSADIDFESGRQKAVNLKPSLMFYGKTQWGNARLEAKDIRKVTFIKK